MPTYAHIETRERRDFDPAPPPNKAHLWLKVVTGQKPACAAGETLSRAEMIIGGELHVGFATVRLSDADLITGIKSEAQRRIIALTGASSLNTCVVKQLNALMRATELARKEASEPLTEAETIEAATLQSLANQIKAIRARSNELEATLPVDFDADERWP